MRSLERRIALLEDRMRIVVCTCRLEVSMPSADGSIPPRIPCPGHGVHWRIPRVVGLPLDDKV